MSGSPQGEADFLFSCRPAAVCGLVVVVVALFGVGGCPRGGDPETHPRPAGFTRKRAAAQTAPSQRKPNGRRGRSSTSSSSTADPCRLKQAGSRGVRLDQIVVTGVHNALKKHVSRQTRTVQGAWRYRAQCRRVLRRKLVRVALRALHQKGFLRAQVTVELDRMGATLRAGVRCRAGQRFLVGALEVASASRKSAHPLESPAKGASPAKSESSAKRVRPTKQARPAKSESPAKGARPTKGESPTKQARPPKGESGISARLRLVLLGLLKVRSGDPFNGGRVAADSARLKAYFKDRGYPFAQVVVRRRSVPSQRRIDVTFQIRKGPRLRIGEIAVRGASATGRWLVERALGSVQVGQYYHHARLAAALQRLQRTGAFERVDFKVLPKSDGTKRVVIRFEVDERPVAAGASNPR